jgi:hypothetical protein
MSEGYEILSREHPVDLRDAPAGEAQGVQMFFTLARMTAILLIAALVIAYFIVTFAVAELKALWPRGRISHTE